MIRCPENMPDIFNARKCSEMAVLHPERGFERLGCGEADYIGHGQGIEAWPDERSVVQYTTCRKGPAQFEREGLHGKNFG